MMGKGAKAWWGFLAVLLLLAVWLTASGHVLLWGFPLRVFEVLAKARGLVPPDGSSVVGLTGLLGRLPGDAVAWATTATVGLNTAAALCLLVAGYKAWKNPISPVLAVGAAFFGAKTMWVKSLTPHDSLLHLLLALSLVALIAGTVPLLAGLVLCTAVVAPEQGVMVYLALAYLCYRRQPAYGLLVPTLALFGVGCLLIPLSGAYRLQPGLQGWQLWTLLPLVLAFYPSSVRQARGGIYLSLLLGSGLTGTAELASALAVADLAFVAFSACAVGASSGGEGLRVPSGLLVSLVATVCLVSLVLPGERYLNREVLIRSHHARVPLPRLFTLLSLSEHAKRFAEQPWRANVPFPRLGSADCEVALDLSKRDLPEGFCPVTLGSLEESRELALVYALIANKRLGGWDNPRQLCAPVLLCKLRGKSFLHQGPQLVLRKDGTAKLVEAVPLAAVPTPLDLRSLMTVAYHPQRIGAKGGAYRWTGAGQSYELSFPDDPTEVLLSDRPGEYHIASLAQTGAQRQLDVPELRWAVSEVEGAVALPSRSLVPMTMRLKNLGRGPISSEMVASWRFAALGSGEPFEQKTDSTFILFPGESMLLTLRLATPEGEGRLRLELEAVTPEGKVLPVPIKEAVEILTWRRMPPVGTWVEEP